MPSAADHSTRCRGPRDSSLRGILEAPNAAKLRTTVRLPSAGTTACLNDAMSEVLTFLARLVSCGPLPSFLTGAEEEQKGTDKSAQAILKDETAAEGAVPERIAPELAVPNKTPVLKGEEVEDGATPSKDMPSRVAPEAVAVIMADSPTDTTSPAGESEEEEEAGSDNDSTRVEADGEAEVAGAVASVCAMLADEVRQAELGIAMESAAARNAEAEAVAARREAEEEAAAESARIQAEEAAAARFAAEEAEALRMAEEAEAAAEAEREAAAAAAAAREAKAEAEAARREAQATEAAEAAALAAANEAARRSQAEEEAVAAEATATSRGNNVQTDQREQVEEEEAPPPAEEETAVPPPPALGAVVRARGLVARSDLNGQCGTVIKEVDHASGRVGVRFEGEMIPLKIKLANLTLAGEEAATASEAEPEAEAGEVVKACEADEAGENIGEENEAATAGAPEMAEDEMEASAIEDKDNALQ